MTIEKLGLQHRAYSEVAMTGQDLRTLLVRKWGYSYDVQMRRTQGKVFLQVMWRYLEQVSFPLTETDYLSHLDQIVTYLEAWNQGEHVRQWIEHTREKPRLGKAVNIPLSLGEREVEWLVDGV